MAPLHEAEKANVVEEAPHAADEATPVDREMRSTLIPEGEPPSPIRLAASRSFRAGGSVLRTLKPHRDDGRWKAHDHTQ